MNIPELQQDDAAVYRFDGWELRVHEHLLIVRGQPVKIGRPAFNLLRALAERAGQVVTKDELLAAAWPGRVVEENNLSVQITALRRLLGPEAVVNVSGVGYRLASAPAHGEEPVPLAEVRPPAPGPSLFGRDADIAAMLALLADAPLVSIVGTGGVGKTSLARALVDTQLSRWRDGVHWIDLALLGAGSPVLQVVAHALGIRAQAFDELSDDLLLSMQPLQALVVLDNCEHLLDEVAGLVGPLLQRAAGIRWLATTQVPLQLGRETVYRLAPLDVPQPGADPARAAGSAALALFRERARGADHHFELDGERLELAAELCRQLDGLPLAIEMAAARVAALGLHGVRDQIDQRLRLRAATRDAPTRQHTLLQTFEWSYGLLSPVEQRVFRRLAPFVGGFSAQMAQQLCCALDEGPGALDAWQMLDALSALVDRSLVQRSPSTAAGLPDRLHLLESARDYARLCLDSVGEAAAARRRHAEVVADAFDTAAYDMERWRDQDWTARYLPEHRNVCAALTWACSAGHPALLARLVAALAQLEHFALPRGEVMHYPVSVECLLEAPPALRAVALSEFGWAHFHDGSRERATELLRGALADFRALGDVAAVYAALIRLIRIALGRPDLQDEAPRLWQQLRQIDERAVPLRSRLVCGLAVAHHFEGVRSLEQLELLHQVAHNAGYDGLAAACRLNITDVLLTERSFDQAAVAAQRMLQAGEPVPSMRALICHNLALALVRVGRFAEAAEAAQALLRASPGSAHMVMDLSAFAALQLGQHSAAGLLAGRSAQIKHERALQSEAVEAALIADTLEGLNSALGEARLIKSMAMGAAMANADVLRLAQPA